MRRRFLLLVATLLIAPQLLAAEFPTGIFKGAGFLVEKDNQKLTEKDIHAYSSSVTVVKQSDGSYQFTIVSNLQRTPSTPAKIDKRIDLYRVVWESPTTGKLLNSNSAFKDDKSNFTIGNGQLIIKSWIARNQLWETHFYSLAKQSKDTPKPTQPSKPNESISSAVADMFAGLVGEVNLHPERHAVELYAKGLGWKETNPEMNAMLNAKRGFAGKLAGQTLLLGSDGTNDIFSIAIANKFDPKIFRDRLSGVLTLKVVGSDTSMGQRMDMYRIFDGPKDLGLLSITYGVVEAIQGTGTVGFISVARARREGIGG